jgi:phosphatidylglycerophosphate synthase
VKQDVTGRLPATAGELWTQEVLRELRAARFAPAAWVRFLAASFARARSQRLQRRRAHREALAVGAAGIATWIAVALSGRPGLGAAAAVWWTLVLLMLIWHLGMLERPDGRPLQGLGSANVVSLIRAAVVPLLLTVPPWALAALLVGAGATDVVDGWLARRRDEVSRLGRWLDPAVDCIVVGVAAVAAARLQLLPPWAAVLVIVRYLLPWLGVAAAYFARAQAPDRDVYVSGRLPGALVVIGLVLAGLRLPAGTPLVLVGTGGGLVTFALTVARAAGRPAQADGRAPSVSTSMRPSGKS